MQRLATLILILSLTASAHTLAQEWAPGEEELYERYRELRDAGRFEDAIPVVEEWVKLCELHYGPAHPKTAASLNDMGSLYEKVGNFAKAENAYVQSLNIKQKTLPPGHTDIAITHINLGGLYRDMSDFAKAEQHLLEGLAIFQKALPPDDSDIAAALFNLGVFYQETGDFAKTEKYLLQSLVTWQGTLSPEHPNIATCHNSLGLFYKSMGDFAKAESHYTQSLDIKLKALPPEHPGIAITLINLGGLYRDLSDFTKAEEHLFQGLAILQKALPPEHPTIATCHSSLGLLYHFKGDYAKAEHHYLQSFNIFQKALPANPLDIASSNNNLGGLYRAMGDLVKAEQHLLRCLAIVQKVLPPDHPNFDAHLSGLALVEHKLGRPSALAHSVEANRIQFVNWVNILSFTSEREREAYLDRFFFPFDLPGTIGNGHLAAQASLWRKGSLLEATLQDKRAALAAEADPALANQLRKAESLKDQLRQASLEDNKANLSEDEIQQLNAQLDDLQKTIARTVTGYGSLRKSLQLTLEQVQAAIPETSVLIDFIQYSHYLKQDEWEPRYAAVVIRPGADPVFIPLGKAENLDALITRHREISGTDPSKANVDELDPALHEICRQLHQAIAAPIEAALPEGIEELILCPDAQLHFLAFASLLDEQDRFWVEKFSLHQVATARDLLKRPKARPADGTGEIVLVGDPDLRDTTPLRLMADPKALEDAERQQQEWLLAHTLAQHPNLTRGANLSQLPGAHAESLALQARFQSAGWKTHLLAKEKATEPALMQNVSSPLVLHMAMHGRFQDEVDLGQERQRRSGMEMPGQESSRQRVALKNPMNGSYLALAAAQTTLEQWSRGKVPPLRHDGVLTAAEVASLNLEGTLLVTLSACETGLGRAQSGEGVLGLQRGLALAGAENLLLTLWQIGDGSTGEFMKRFYDRLLAGEHPAHILPQVQRELLVELREEKGLWHAVNAAAPFTLMSHTAVPPQP